MQSCTSKTCQWLQTTAQVLVASMFIYAGYVVNTHMETWSQSFTSGQKDLQSIRMNMNTIAYSMESINQDMDYMKQSMYEGVGIAEGMKTEIVNLTKTVNSMNSQLYYMNQSVGSINNNFSPTGMFGSMMPF
jgi:methyl-accepting chemotaxis protein